MVKIPLINGMNEEDIRIWITENTDKDPDEALEYLDGLETYDEDGTALYPIDALDRFINR